MNQYVCEENRSNPTSVTVNQTSEIFKMTLDAVELCVQITDPTANTSPKANEKINSTIYTVYTANIDSSMT